MSWRLPVLARPHVSCACACPGPRLPDHVTGFRGQALLHGPGMTNLHVTKKISRLCFVCDDGTRYMTCVPALRWPEPCALNVSCSYLHYSPKNVVNISNLHPSPCSPIAFSGAHAHVSNSHPAIPFRRFPLTFSRTTKGRTVGGRLLDNPHSVK
jgi:hypothetical protein